MKILKKTLNYFDFFILTCVTVLFIPFFGLSSTIDPVLTPRFLVWSIVVFALLVSFLIQLCKNSDKIDYSILRRMIFPAFLGYLLFSLISLAKALNITEGIYEILKILVSIVYLFLATVILSKNRNYIPILIKTIIVAATALSLIGLYDYFTYGFGVSGLYPITGTMAQRNLFSSALFLMFPFCLYSILCFDNYWKVLCIIPSTLILILLLLNQTRSVWLASLVSTAVTIFALMLLFLFGKSKIVKEAVAYVFKMPVYIVTVLVIVGTLFGYLYLRSTPINALVGRFSSIFSSTHENNEIRISMWKQTLELAQDNPICGVGVGNWKISFPSYGIEDFPDQHMFNTLFFVRPENDYLWILSEVGIFGFILYLSLFVIIFWYIFKILNQHTATADKLLSILMFFGFVGYMVFSCFTFPKERIFHSMFLLLMMAIIISTYHRTSDSRKKIPRPFMFAAGIPAEILLFLAVVNGYTRLNAEVYTKRAFTARKANAWPAVINEIDKGYSDFATLDPMSTPLKWYRGEANFLMNNIPQALEDFKQAYKAHPHHIHVLNNLGTCCEIGGDHDKAVFYYKKALEMFPEFEEALINLGATYYNTGRYKEAYDAFLRCNPGTKDSRLKMYLEITKKELDKNNKL